MDVLMNKQILPFGTMKNMSNSKQNMLFKGVKSESWIIFTCLQHIYNTGQSWIVNKLNPSRSENTKLLNLCQLFLSLCNFQDNFHVGYKQAAVCVYFNSIQRSYPRYN